ncbi:ATP-dependent DNA helicase PIF1-like protein, partial [Leptotrombidium deliense]
MLNLKQSIMLLFYIDEPGGCGKTFLYHCLIHNVICPRKKIFTIAWTIIAVILLPFGKPAHKSLQLTDEASMIPAAALDSIDIELRDICKTQQPFGGKIMLGGDFRKLLPVVKRAGKSQIIKSTIKQCEAWSYFSQLLLSKNMRAPTDTDFAD